MVSRCWYLILLAGINFSNVYMMADKTGGRLIVGGYNVKWSSDQLIKFRKCICNEKSQACIINVDWDWVYYKVSDIKQEEIGRKIPEHMNMYVCFYDNNWEFHIHCRRQTDSTGRNNGNPYSVQCQEHCMDVIMKGITFNGDYQVTVLKPGLCLASSTALTTEVIPTTEEFEKTDTSEVHNNRTGEARRAESGNIDDNKDDNTSLITGVVVGTAVAVVIAISAVVVLLWRKRCKHSENKSNENHVSSHEVIPFQELPSDTVSNNRVVNPAYGFQEITHMEKHEKSNDVNIYCLPDSYEDNKGPSYTCVDTADMGRKSNIDNCASNDISRYVNCMDDNRDNTHGSYEEAAYLCADISKPAKNTVYSRADIPEPAKNTVYSFADISEPAKNTVYSFADIPEPAKNTMYSHLGERTMEKTNQYDALDQSESMTVSDQSNDYENHNVVNHMST